MGSAHWHGPTPVGPQRLATYMVISMPKRSSAALGVSRFIPMSSKVLTQRREVRRDSNAVLHCQRRDFGKHGCDDLSATRSVLHVVQLAHYVAGRAACKRRRDR